jgi:hypothetical protein
VIATVSARPVAAIDGRSCVLLAPHLRTMTTALEAARRLDTIHPAVDAIEHTARAQHELDHQAFDAHVVSDWVSAWVSAADAASLVRCNRQNIRKRLARGPWRVNGEAEPGPWT